VTAGAATTQLVTPAEAGVHVADGIIAALDSRLRGNDEKDGGRVGQRESRSGTTQSISLYIGAIQPKATAASASFPASA
jgi:hypothetical protein